MNQVVAHKCKRVSYFGYWLVLDFVRNCCSIVLSSPSSLACRVSLLLLSWISIYNVVYDMVYHLYTLLLSMLQTIDKRSI